MAGMGPAPKADRERRRRNATVAMAQLPAEGRKKRAPNWPLIPDVVLTARAQLAEEKLEGLQARLRDIEEAGLPAGYAERRVDQALELVAILRAQLREQRKLEAILWRDLWRLPQAVRWEQLGWTRDVAQYVRHKVLGELGELNDAKEARQWSDRLGLTPMAMLRLRWEIVADELAPRREAAPTTRATARDMLRVVDPGAVAG